MLDVYCAIWFPSHQSLLVRLLFEGQTVKLDGLQLTIYMAFISRSIRFSPVTCSNHFTHFGLDLFDFFWLEWCVTTIAWNKTRCCDFSECCKLPEYFFFGIPNPSWAEPIQQPILGWNWNLGRPSKNSGWNSGKPTLQFIYQQKPSFTQVIPW